MDAKTLEALKASIAKWEKNARVRKPWNYLVGPKDCPLCDLYWSYFDQRSCSGCPVFEKTGEQNCRGTPYLGAAQALHFWELSEHPAYGRECRSLALDEVDFLKSLLPEGEE